MKSWEYYTTAMGNSVVAKELKQARLSLDEAARLRVLQDRIADDRANWGTDVKPLRDGVYELRMKVGPRSFRLAFAPTDDGFVLLALHFFQKQQRRQPADVDLAADRWKDWQERHQD